MLLEAERGYGSAGAAARAHLASQRCKPSCRTFTPPAAPAALPCPADITSGPMGLTSADPIVFEFASQSGLSSGAGCCAGCRHSTAASREGVRVSCFGRLCGPTRRKPFCSHPWRLHACGSSPSCTRLPWPPLDQASRGSASWATLRGTSPTPPASTTGDPAPRLPPTLPCQTGPTSLLCGRR